MSNEKALREFTEAQEKYLRATGWAKTEKKTYPSEAPVWIDRVTLRYCAQLAAVFRQLDRDEGRRDEETSFGSGLAKQGRATREEYDALRKAVS